uniref:C-type lectin domain-containing protein n=1 Tax=Erpetoichthys calabaricus TaxID=27687 RepID=A0A8C4RTQ4_ERPCA
MMSCSVTQFTFVSNNQTWDAAQRYCRSTFTDLVTVENEEINQQLVNVSQGKSFWIGLRRNRDNWQWSSGENVTYTNWNRNFFCAFVQSDGSWNNNSSSTKMPFMCYNGRQSKIYEYSGTSGHDRYSFQNSGHNPIWS